MSGSTTLTRDREVARRSARAPHDAVSTPEPPRRLRRRIPRGLVVAVCGSVLILVVLEVLALRLIRVVAEDEALEQAGSITADVALIALTPYLTEALLDGDPAAIRDVDQAADELLEHADVAHVKIWTGDGTVVWSDETDLIGRRFELDYDELEFLHSFGSQANVSDLSEAENAIDAETADRLLEVYLGTRTDAGTPILVETYSPYRLVEERAAKLRDTFVPPVTIVLALLALGQIALVWLLGRRIARSETRRAELLERMISASDAERRRVAGEVHDGVVQDLIGITFALSGAAHAGHADADELDALAASTRGAVGTLRGLLSSIYPVDVPEGGWQTGLVEVIDTLRAEGAHVDISVQVDALSAVEELLVLRIAREALRNVAKHADADHVLVELNGDRDALNLTVRDNGVGFDPAARPDGHLGLRLLDDMVGDAGGTLAIESRPHGGTTVSFEMARTR